MPNTEIELVTNTVDIVSHSLSTNEFTNSSVTILLTALTEEVSGFRLPDNSFIASKNLNFEVFKNGNYVFYAELNNGEKIPYEVKIRNIDKTNPNKPVFSVNNNGLKIEEQGDLYEQINNSIIEKFENNFFNLDFKFENEEWIRTDKNKFEGTYALSSPSINNGETTTASITVNVPKDKNYTLNLNYLISCQNKKAYGNIYINETPVASNLTGSSDGWKNFTINLEEGDNTIKFEYKKELGNGKPQGLDALLIDNIELLTGSEIIPPSNVQDILYKINDSEWKIYSQELNIENFSSSNNTIYAKTIDHAGNESEISSWTPKNFPVILEGSLDDTYFDSIKINDNYIAVGHTNSPDITNNKFGNDNKSLDIITSIYDKYGNNIKNIIIGGTGDECFNSISESPDGGFVAVGYTHSYDYDFKNLNNATNRRSDGVIVKFNPHYEIEWIKNFGGDKHDQFTKVITDNDGFIVVGSAESKNDDLANLPHVDSEESIILKYDFEGNLIWASNIPLEGYEKLLDITPTSDGYIAVGYSNADGHTSTLNEELLNTGISGHIVKFNKDGQLLWNKVYNSDFNSLFKSVAIYDGDIIIAGSYEPPINTLCEEASVLKNGLVLRFDGDGNLIWEKVIESSTTGELNSITINEHGFIVGGYIDSKIDKLEEDFNNSGVAIDMLGDGTIIGVNRIELDNNAKVTSIFRDNNNYILSGFYNNTSKDGFLYKLRKNNPPIINFENLTIPIGSRFNPKEGVFAYDENEVNISDKIEIVKNNVDINTPGKYSILYQVTDDRGYLVRKERTITVLPKITSINHAPKITADDISIIKGDNFEPLIGVSAYDYEDGDLTKNIEIIENNVDINVAGVYTIIYRVCDKLGASTTYTRAITVTQPLVKLNKPPKIYHKLNHKNIILAKRNLDMLKSDIIAYDEEDGDLTDKIEIIESNIDYNIHGTYIVKYKVTDNDGASSFLSLNAVVENNDNLYSKPKILTSSLNLPKNSSFDPLIGTIAYDEIDGDLTDKIEITENEVNTSTPGVYKVEYRVINSLSVTSHKDRYISIYNIDYSEDNSETKNSLPSIIASDKTIYVGDTFNPLDNVTGFDEEDGDLTDNITIVKNEVNTNTPGTYRIIYSLSDSSNNFIVKEIYITVLEKDNNINSNSNNNDNNNNYNPPINKPSTSDNINSSIILLISSILGLKIKRNKRR